MSAKVLKTVAMHCVARVDALELKGKKATDAAIHFFLGAYAGLLIAGQKEEADHVATVTAILISTRGMDEVRTLAAMEAEDEAPKGWDSTETPKD